LEDAEEVCGKDNKPAYRRYVKELDAKNCHLAMENDFLSVTRGRIGEPGAKK